MRVQRWFSWLRELGHSCFILLSEGEPALVAFRDAVREKFLTEAAAGASRVEHLSCRASPIGSHQPNGGAERAVQTLRGLARVYLDLLYSHTGTVTIGAVSPWWPWALRHAAWIYNRFHVSPDLKCTPYTKLQGIV